MYRIIFLISSSLAMLCSALQVGEFASKAFVQRALRSPNTPSAVISFLSVVSWYPLERVWFRSYFWNECATLN